MSIVSTFFSGVQRLDHCPYRCWTSAGCTVGPRENRLRTSADGRAGAATTCATRVVST